MLNCTTQSGTVDTFQKEETMIFLDLRSNTPIYEQIIHQVKEFVLKGYLQPGESIPSVRKLAMDLDITPGTVAKAYQELERQHVIETIRGKGTFIAVNSGSALNKEKLEESTKNMRSLLVELKYMGLGAEEIHGLVAELLRELEE